MQLHRALAAAHRTAARGSGRPRPPLGHAARLVFVEPPGWRGARRLAFARASPHTERASTVRPAILLTATAGCARGHDRPPRGGLRRIAPTPPRSLRSLSA